MKNVVYTNVNTAVYTKIKDFIEDIAVLSVANAVFSIIEPPHHYSQPPPPIY